MISPISPSSISARPLTSTPLARSSLPRFYDHLPSGHQLFTHAPFLSVYQPFVPVRTPSKHTRTRPRGLQGVPGLASSDRRHPNSPRSRGCALTLLAHRPRGLSPLRLPSACLGLTAVCLDSAVWVSSCSPPAPVRHVMVTRLAIRTAFLSLSAQSPSITHAR